MTTRNLPTGKAGLPTGKAGKITYWLATIWLALGMSSSGVVQLLKVEAEIDFYIKIGLSILFSNSLGHLENFRSDSRTDS